MTRASLDELVDQLAETLESYPDAWFNNPKGWLLKPNFTRPEQDRANHDQNGVPVNSKGTLFSMKGVKALVRGSPYQKRWFILNVQRRSLSYYVKDDGLDTTESGTIDLTDIILVQRSKIPDAPQFAMDLVSHDKYYTIGAENEVELTRWCHAINSCRPQLLTLRTRATKYALPTSTSMKTTSTVTTARSTASTTSSSPTASASAALASQNLEKKRDAQQPVALSVLSPPSPRSTASLEQSPVKRAQSPPLSRPSSPTGGTLATAGAKPNGKTLPTDKGSQPNTSPPWLKPTTTSSSIAKTVSAETPAAPKSKPLSLQPPVASEVVSPKVKGKESVVGKPSPAATADVALLEAAVAAVAAASASPGTRVERSSPDDDIDSIATPSISDQSSRHSSMSSRHGSLVSLSPRWLPLGSLPTPPDGVPSTRSSPSPSRSGSNASSASMLQKSPSRASPSLMRPDGIASTSPVLIPASARSSPTLMRPDASSSASSPATSTSVSRKSPSPSTSQGRPPVSNSASSTPPTKGSQSNLRPLAPVPSQSVALAAIASARGSPTHRGLRTPSPSTPPPPLVEEDDYVAAVLNSHTTHVRRGSDASVRRGSDASGGMRRGSDASGGMRRGSDASMGLPSPKATESETMTTTEGDDDDDKSDYVAAMLASHVTWGSHRSHTPRSPGSPTSGGASPSGRQPSPTNYARQPSPGSYARAPRETSESKPQPETAPQTYAPPKLVPPVRAVPLMTTAALDEVPKLSPNVTPRKPDEKHSKGSSPAEAPTSQLSPRLGQPVSPRTATRTLAPAAPNAMTAGTATGTAATQSALQPQATQQPLPRRKASANNVQTPPPPQQPGQAQAQGVVVDTAGKTGIGAYVGSDEPGKWTRYDCTFEEKGPLMLKVMGSTNIDIATGKVVNNWIVVTAFEQTAGGKPGRAEATGLIKLKDYLVAVNGTDLTGHTFNECMDILSRATFPKTLQFLRDNLADKTASQAEGWAVVFYPSLNRKGKRYVEIRSDSISFRKPAPGGSALAHRDASLATEKIDRVKTMLDRTLPEDQQHILRITCKSGAHMDHVADDGSDRGQSPVEFVDLCFATKEATSAFSQALVTYSEGHTTPQGSTHREVNLK